MLEPPSKRSSEPASLPESPGPLVAPSPSVVPEAPVLRGHLGDTPMNDLNEEEVGQLGREDDLIARSRKSSLQSSWSSMSGSGNDTDLSDDVEPGLDLLEDVDMESDIAVELGRDEPAVGIESNNTLSNSMEVDDVDSSVRLIESPFELRRSTRNANAKNQPTVKSAMTQISSSSKKRPAPKKDEFLLQASFPIKSFRTG